MNFLERVNSLILLKKEGVYWDFKRQHHSSKGDLLHDILCLTNAEHNGDRFLIFGVDDGSMCVPGVASDINR